jgi:hypothetical protein
VAASITRSVSVLTLGTFRATNRERGGRAEGGTGGKAEKRKPAMLKSGKAEG